MGDWNLDPVIQKQKKRGVLEQRERIPPITKRPPKPWVVCWAWSPKHLPNNVSRRRFATEQQALAFKAKRDRAFACHPHSGEEWGPAKCWVEGPAERSGDADA